MTGRPQLQLALRIENASGTTTSSSNTASSPHIAPYRPPTIASSDATTLLPEARPPAARLALRQLPPAITLPVPVQAALFAWSADPAIPINQYTAEALPERHGKAECEMDFLHLGH